MWDSMNQNVLNYLQMDSRINRLVSSYQLNAHFLYSITIYMLHYNPQHVSSNTLLIFRWTNCIITASGIITLCKWPYSMLVESGLQSALHLHTVQLLTEGDDTRGCGDTIGILRLPHRWQRVVHNAGDYNEGQ